MAAEIQTSMAIDLAGNWEKYKDSVKGITRAES